MKIIPLADRVVIKTVEVEETTKGGLILTGSAKEKPQVAQVIAVGPGGVVDGKEVKMTVKVGDRSSPASIPAPRSKWMARSAPSCARATSWPSWKTERFPLFLENAALKGAIDYGKADQAGRGRPQGTVCRY